MSIPGLLTAMVTPYKDDLSVNYDKAAELAEYLCDNGTEAIVVCGTTGESPVLSVDEKLKLYAVVKERVGSSVPVWAGTGSNDTAATVELSKKADKIGVDGIMLVTPYYNKPTQEGLYQHFRAVAENISLPVMLYNVPGRTSSNLLPETIASLAEISNIKAVKEASGNMDQVSLLKSIIPEQVLIYSGDDSITLPLMAIGVQGVVSIASHIVGNEIRAMVDAFKKGDLEKARQLHLELFPIFKGLFITTNPIPVKAALNMMGKEVGGFRLPLTDPSAEEEQFIKNLLMRYNKI
ncbi:dihydrodipicolinate synthase [hydrocarbon metagenome]|uniref:4-hydroxy-tetrahydrodipicolinate synthase n=1 Tax=hydrocarbon metagenome TaxID=938273 RepID=A0A0W8E5B3_9ZZZZ